MTSFRCPSCNKPFVAQTLKTPTDFVCTKCGRPFRVTPLGAGNGQKDSRMDAFRIAEKKAMRDGILGTIIITILLLLLAVYLLLSSLLGMGP